MAGQTGRDPVIDAIRGLALLGILIANLSFFAMPGGVAGLWWRGASPGAGDLAATFVIRTLFENTFILIFSFLFGYGAARQIKTRPPAWFRWRLLGLGVVGVLHALLLWAGDILLAYALIGLFLPAAMRWASPRLLRTGLLLWAVAIVGNALVGALLVVMSPQPPDPAAAIALHRAGDFAALLQIRLMEWAEFYGFGVVVLFPLVAAAFLGGLAAEHWLAGRAPSALTPPISRAAHLAFWPAVLGNIAYGALASTPKTGTLTALIAPEIILRALFSPLLVLLILAWSLRLFTSPAGRHILKPFAANGRMSLSVYIAQSIACALLLEGYGAGLYGSFGPAVSLLAAIALFAGMALLAQAWLRVFSQGPLEMALTAITAPRGGAGDSDWRGKEALEGRHKP